MKLYFVRHGQTDWNVAKRIQGSKDIELNSNGRRQAKALSESIRTGYLTFNGLYTSPQKRALETAEILGEAVGMNPIKLEGLREINLGKWEGLGWHEVSEQYPDEYAVWFENRRYTKPPHGESYEELLHRLFRDLEELMREESGDIVFVTHSAVIMCIQCFITDTPFNEMVKFKTKNSDVTEIEGEILLKKIREAYQAV